MKRWRKPYAKLGELKVAYGKCWDKEDVFYCHGGDGAARCDTRMLMQFFERKNSLSEKTLREELIERGYDITTIKFSIQQKKK